MLVTSLENTALDTLDAITYVSVHHTFSATGANELNGLGYVRQFCSWTTAASGFKSSSTELTFQLIANDIVSWFGFWTDVTSGTFLGMVPNGGILPSYPKVFVLDDTSSDVLRSIDHNLLDNDPLVIWAGNHALPTISGGGGSLVEGGTYYAVVISPHTFKLAGISGGTPIDFDGVGQGFWQRHNPQVMPSTGAFRILSLTAQMILS